jgi:hypothetical protein
MTLDQVTVLVGRVLISLSVGFSLGGSIYGWWDVISDQDNDTIWGSQVGVSFLLSYAFLRFIASRSDAKQDAV